MIRILANLTQEQADTFALVLASAGITSHIRGETSACELWVDEAHAQEALGLIRDYCEENRPQRPPDRPRLLREYGHTTAGLWGCLILLACYLAMVHSGGLNANFTTDRDRKLASPPALRHNRSTDQDTGLWSRCACLDWPGLL